MSLLDLAGKRGLVLGIANANSIAYGCIVLGARIPIILTSRADTVLARMASCAVALIAARRGDRAAP